MSFKVTGSGIIEDNKKKTEPVCSVGSTRDSNKKAVKTIISEKKQELKAFKYNIFNMLQ
jgi:hypothetical protein